MTMQNTGASSDCSMILILNFIRMNTASRQSNFKRGRCGEDIIHAVCSHGYGITVGCGKTIDVEPVHEMEKVLFAADELTDWFGL